MALPNELWGHIFLHLDYPSILRCKGVCRGFNNIITESAEIQYHGELAMDGMLDTGTSSLSVKDRLALLRERRSAWDNLQWKLFPPQDIPGAYLAYNFVGGIFGIVQDDNVFTAMTLPTTTSEGSKKSHQLDFAPRNFAMDPTQDVVIFLAEITMQVLRYHLIFSMAPHPHSESPRILVHPEERPQECVIQIIDDIFALACSTEDDTELWIRIWNWKSGERIHERILTGPDARADSFTLLSSKAFLIGVASGSGYIGIWNLDSGTEVSRLCFPELIAGELEDAAVDASPYFAQPWPDGVFMTSPEKRIHVFSLSYWEDEAEISLRAHVLNELLLSYAKPPTINLSLDPVQVRWEDWGPRNTRVLLIDSSNDDVRSLAHSSFSDGLRTLLPLVDGESYLHILDFNFPRKLAENTKTPESSAASTTFRDPTTISYPQLFRTDIITSLPYTMHKRVFPLADSYPDVLLSERHIIAVLDDVDPAQIHTMAI
ncbi:hypothetical protein BDN72DRAFT_903256 [Pluteus cervinus]|uniref:Uncharacterized protein n=1 Tax=Pluteus cervinus TaxID=181527 RepID=A0ACD3A9P6_9AGAR|nr:hypothetical protein BDN72DRAFT_903256 [Pluteus cervinus]